MRTVTTPQELPTVSHYLLVRWSKYVEIIPCTAEQGKALLQEACEYRATWTEEGQRRSKLILREGKPIFSPRKLYLVCEADEFFRHWRAKGKSSSR